MDMTDLPNPAVEPTLSVERTGELFDVSRSNAYGGVKDGTIPSIRIGRRIVVPTAELLRLLGWDPAEVVAAHAALDHAPRAS